MRFDAVIFDLDGTLLDTLEDIADAANSVLAAHGYPTHSLADFRYFVGDGARELTRRVLPEKARDDATVDKILAEFKQQYGANWNNKTSVYAGVPEMLDGLVARGLALAVLSNKPDDFTKNCVAELLPDWSFEIVIGLREGLPPKPDPMGAFDVARRLGFRSQRIVFVGDTSVDMKTAVAAGMFPVGALWGFRTADELQLSGAQAIIEKPEDVLSLLL
jgi:phosphoglycolate phosphatase